MTEVIWNNGEITYSYDEEKTSVKSVFAFIDGLSIDLPDKDANTILYSGKYANKSISEVIPHMKNIRAIDHTLAGRFLGDADNKQFKCLLKNSIVNDIKHNLFDLSIVEECSSPKDIERCNDYMRDGKIQQVAKLALPAILYHPTRGLWAKVSERFVKAVPNESDVMLLIPHANPGRTFAKVELPTALATFDDNHRFGGFSAIRLKKLQERCDTKAVFDLLVSNAQKEEAFFCEKFPTDSLSNAQFAETIQKVLLAFDQHRQKMELEKFGGTPLKEEK